MMEKVTKEIITRETIEKEPRFLNRAAMRHSILLLVPCILVIIPLALLLIVEILSITGILLWRVLSCTTFGLMTLSPVLGMIYMLCATFAKSRLLSHGAFDVTTYEVSYKSEEYIHRRCVELLHFIGLEKPVEVGHTVYQLTSAGDTFYLVTYRTPKPSPKLLYSSKMYEYKE